MRARILRKLRPSAIEQRRESSNLSSGEASYTLVSYRRNILEIDFCGNRCHQPLLLFYLSDISFHPSLAGADKMWRAKQRGNEIETRPESGSEVEIKKNFGAKKTKVVGTREKAELLGTGLSSSPLLRRIKD